MPALPENIISSLVRVPNAERLAQAYLYPVDMAPGETPPWVANGGTDAIAFQYWPETIQDTRACGWNANPIPGGSHPIYQWSSSGERTLSFDAVFTTDTAPNEDALSAATSPVAGGGVGGPSTDPYAHQRGGELAGLRRGTRDIDLRAVIAWLRWYTYPYYGQSNDQRAFEPAKCGLVMPNMGLAYDGSDDLITVMTGCDVNYEACFASGFPRVISVSLSFAEVIQSGQRVAFQSRAAMSRAAYIGNYLSVRSSE